MRAAQLRVQATWLRRPIQRCLAITRQAPNPSPLDCPLPARKVFIMIEDHEIEVVIKDIGNNTLKVEKVPARAARVTIYVQTGNLTPLAPDVCPVCCGDQYMLFNDGLMHPCPSCEATGKRR